MNSLSFRGITVWLVTEPPDWSTPVEGRFSIVQSTEASLTRQEGRRAYSQTLRTRLRYTVLVANDSARALSAALRQITTEPVLLPFWPSQRSWGDRAASPISSGLQVVASAEQSRWTVFTPDHPPDGPLPGDFWAPLLWGFLAPTQTLDWLNDALLRWTVDFTEAGPPEYALESTVSPALSQALSVGPLPDGYAVAPSVFGFPLQWDQRTDQLKIHIQRQPPGFRRQQTATFYPQSVAQSGPHRSLLTSSIAIGQWLSQVRGFANGSVFWLPSGTSLLQLTRDVPATGGTLPVTDTGTVQVGDTLALIQGDAVAGCRVQTILSPNQISLDRPAGMALSAATSTVSRLLLVILDTAEFTLTWTHTDMALGEFAVREVPGEYVLPQPADGSLVGPQVGVLPARAWLYQFSTWIAGVAYPTYWTSYESDVTWAGQTYLSADLSHGDITDSLDLERTTVEFTARIAPGNPLLPHVLGTSEGPITLTILSATLAAGRVTGAQSVFSGEVTRVAVRGSIINAQVMPGGNRWAAQWPRWLRGPTCNATVFHDGCNLNPAVWRWTASVVGPVSAQWPYQLTVARVTGSGPMALADADAFALGWIEWGAGAATQRRPIVVSTALAGGQTTVTLGRWFSANPLPNDAVVLIPGCDQQWTTCRKKFANQLNFRGHPFIPAGNPSLVKRSDNGSGGKK